MSSNVQNNGYSLVPTSEPLVLQMFAPRKPPVPSGQIDPNHKVSEAVTRKAAAGSAGSAAAPAALDPKKIKPVIKLTYAPVVKSQLDLCPPEPQVPMQTYKPEDYLKR